MGRYLPGKESCSEWVRKFFTSLLTFSLVYGPLPVREAKAVESLSAASAYASDEQASGSQGGSSGAASTDAKGNLTYSISLPQQFIPAGLAGGKIEATFTYNSAQRNVDGIMGIGWSPSFPSVIRRIGPTDSQPQPTFTIHDRFQTPWGIVVPIEDPEQDEVEYRLVSDHRIHFTFSHLNNCWEVLFLESGVKQTFCEVEKDPAELPALDQATCQLQLFTSDEAQSNLYSIYEGFNPVAGSLTDINDEIEGEELDCFERKEELDPETFGHIYPNEKSVTRAEGFELLGLGAIDSNAALGFGVIADQGAGKLYRFE